MTRRTNVFGEDAFGYLRVIILTAICLLSCLSTAHAISVVQGDLAPDFTALTIDGEEVSLSDYRGSAVFIAFWSSWCSRCKEEMEYLNDLQKSYPSVQFLAINSESEKFDPETVKRMETVVRDWGISFTVLVDKGLKIWDMFGIQALPTSLIVDPDGTIVFVEPNFYFASATNIENALLELFNPKPRVSQSDSKDEQ